MFERDGVAVVVDDVSLDLLNGAETRFCRGPDGRLVPDQEPERRLVLRLRQLVFDLTRPWAGARPLAALTAP